MSLSDEDDEASSEDPRADRGSRTFRRSLVSVFFAALAVFAQMYSPQGLLPDIARDLGVSPDAASLAVGATTTGVALAVLPWARLSDRFGRVRSIRVSLLLSAALGLATSVAPTFELFILMRFITGLALAGLPAIVITALSETLRPHVLGGAVGVFVAGNALGGLIGRLAAGLAGDPLGWRWGVLTVAALSTTAIAVSLSILPQTRVSSGAGAPILRAALANIRNPGVLVLLVQGFLLMGGFTVVYSFLAFRLEAPPFDLDLAQISWLFLSYVAAVVVSPWVWRLTTRASPTTVFLISLLGVLLGLGLMLLPSLSLVIIGVFLFTGAFFGAHSIANGLVGRRAYGTEGASQAPALYTLSFYIGTSVFGWVGGVVFAAAGWAASVGVCALIMLCTAALSWWYSCSRR